MLPYGTVIDGDASSHIGYTRHVKELLINRISLRRKSSYMLEHPSILWYSFLEREAVKIQSCGKSAGKTRIHYSIRVTNRKIYKPIKKLKCMVNEYVTLEQAETYAQLYQKLVDIDSNVESLRTQHQVFRKRAVMKAFAVDIPAYEKQVPEDVREQLGFDLTGLVQKLTSLM